LQFEHFIRQILRSDHRIRGIFAQHAELPAGKSRIAAGKVAESSMSRGGVCLRQIDEYTEVRLAGSTHIFLGELPDRLDELDRAKPVVTFCGSGKRAIIAASILKKNGFDQVADNLGSMQACKNVGCELTEA
jgi:rhodanese-related sulfurtransferase